MTWPSAPIASRCSLACAACSSTSPISRCCPEPELKRSVAWSRPRKRTTRRARRVFPLPACGRGTIALQIRLVRGQLACRALDAVADVFEKARQLGVLHQVGGRVVLARRDTLAEHDLDPGI